MAGRRTLLVVGTLYAVAVVVLRWNHIGDVAHEIALAERWLRGEPLYATVVPGQGSLWPPFASLALVPFALLARLSINVATAAWSVVGVACLVASVLLAQRWGWKAALIALLAVTMPVQTNFEHHNVNTVLLVLVMAGAADLADGRDRRAGVWFGLAAALKAFPVVLLAYLAMRRQWRAVAAGIVAMSVATLIPLARYGPAGAVSAMSDWLNVGLNQGQWQLATSDQSIRALALRLGVSPDVAIWLVIVPFVLMFVVAARRRRVTGDLNGIGAATLAAVLVAPIAWVHYYVLAFPAWLAVAATQQIAQDGDPPVIADRRLPLARLRLIVIWIAAIATSGLLTAGRGPLRRALLEAGVYTWGGLLLLVLLATMQPPPAETG